MQKKEARIYLEDGIVVGAFVSDPEISVSVVDYDRDIDDRKAFEKMFSVETGKQVMPKIIHPSASDIPAAEEKQQEMPADPGTKLATFVSVWDGGREICSPCVVDMTTHEILSVIACSDTTEDLEYLERESVRIGDDEYPVDDMDSAEPGAFFWFAPENANM